MFSNSRARSGIIVLPCGAGKTLVGITATCTIKKRTIVLCNSSVSCEQWRNQYILWSTIDPKKVVRLTSKSKDKMFNNDESGILITTYPMISHSTKRSEEN